MLPLDVLLVDGNTFRVPARRVWEKDGKPSLAGEYLADFWPLGSKGLLKWLADRI